MRKYIDYAIFWDFLIISIIGLGIYFGKSVLSNFLNIPTIENLNGFNGSLITVCATLIGFLLTIITVIVTFKEGFEDRKNEKKIEILPTEIPDITIFERTISKESKFYNTPIHKNVVDVFINATYEIGIILFILLLIQFNIFNISILWVTILNLCVFILLIISIIRCMYIFKLFLGVHLHNKKLSD